MNLEIRNNKIIIDGYVNAVDRFSRPIKERNSVFVEKIMPGAFGRALKQADEIPVLLDHDKDRVLATTKDGTAKIYEDNIGLRAIVEISDAEVIKKANQDLLRGWSFSFITLEDEKQSGKQFEERTIKDLILQEISIIDERKIPCYAATSIEMRSQDDLCFVEYRSGEFDATINRKEELEQQVNYDIYYDKIKKLEEVER